MKEMRIRAENFIGALAALLVCAALLAGCSLGITNNNDLDNRNELPTPTPTPTPLFPAGAPCATNLECESRSCVSGLCAAAATPTPTPTPFCAPATAPCGANSQCCSGICSVSGACL